MSDSGCPWRAYDASEHKGWETGEQQIGKTKELEKGKNPKKKGQTQSILRSAEILRKWEWKLGWEKAKEKFTLSLRKVGLAVHCEEEEIIGRFGEKLRDRSNRAPREIEPRANLGGGF